MSPAARRLRRADEQQLEVARTALGRGRFVVVVATAADWPLVLEALGVEPVGELQLETEDDVMRMFASSACEGQGVVVLHVGEQAEGAMAALNLHRDKLQRGSCRFLLHLVGIEAYRRFLHDAPDAYSVRDATAVVEGNEEAVSVKFTPDVESDTDIERRINQERSAKALGYLGDALRERGRWKLGNRAYDRGIALLSSEEQLSPDDRFTLAVLHVDRHLDADRENAYRHIQEANRVFEPVQEQHKDDYVKLLGWQRDYYGKVISSSREAIRLAEQMTPPDADLVLEQVLGLAKACWERADIPGARSALDRVKVPWWIRGEARYAVDDLEAQILQAEGRWRDARAKLKNALSAARPRSRAEAFSRSLAWLLFRQGEPEAGLQVIANVDTDWAADFPLMVRRCRVDPEAFRDLQEPSYVPRFDEDLPGALASCREDASMTRLAVRAGILPPESLQRMEAAIAALAAYVARVAHTDPPWSRIDAELLVADQYLARAGEVPEALEPAERGLALARQGAPELIAKCARRVVVAALRSGAAERVDTLLDEAAQAAEVHHLLGESARTAGLRLWRAVHAGRAVDVAEKALEQALDRSGSVFVKIDVLLHTGRGTGRRDLVARARRIARSLPYPLYEGACLEALGLMDAARERYLAAGLRLDAMALERDPTPTPIGA